MNSMEKNSKIFMTVSAAWRTALFLGLRLQRRNFANPERARSGLLLNAGSLSSGAKGSHMSLFPTLCAILSIVSGVAGYKMAVMQAPQNVKSYVVAVTMGMFLQTLMASIASNRKDKLILASTEKIRRTLRVDLVVCIAWLLAAGFLSVSAFARLPDNFGLYLGLICVGIAFQYATFMASGREQVVDPDRFWSIQLSGAFVRALGTGLLVLWFEINYTGILLSNLLASLVICHRYKAWPVVDRRRLTALGHSVTQGQAVRALRLDGVLRAGKGQFEAIATSLCAIGVDLAGILPAKTVEADYMAVGYLNTLSTNIRQAFARWELHQPASLSARLLSLAVSGGAAIIAWEMHDQWHLFDLLLPRSDRESLNHIVGSGAVLMALYPLTRGFLYVDYLAPSDMLRFGCRLLLAYMLCSFSILFVLWKSVPLFALGWCLPVPLSIAFAMHKVHARIA